MPPINFENQTDRTANTQVSDIHNLAVSNNFYSKKNCKNL